MAANKAARKKNAKPKPTKPAGGRVALGGSAPPPPPPVAAPGGNQHVGSDTNIASTPAAGSKH